MNNSSFIFGQIAKFPHLDKLGKNYSRKTVLPLYN